MDKNLGLLGVELEMKLCRPASLIEMKLLDMTPSIIRQKQYKTRKVISNNYVVAFLDYLVEIVRMNGEFKFMFHYRWYPQEDTEMHRGYANSAKVWICQVKNSVFIQTILQQTG